MEEKEITDFFATNPHLNIKDFVFLETGTYLGLSSRRAAKHFSEVYTIELSNDLYKDAIIVALEEGINTDNYILGDTTKVLPEIIPKIVKNKSIFFFMDAHISGADSTYNGNELVPLITELKIINALYPKNKKGVIIVDDVRLFDKFHDWKDITTENIKKTLSNHTITSEKVENDRYWITIN